MITIYSISNCKFCHQAKVALDIINARYEVFHVEDDQKAAVLDRLGFTELKDRTYPRIYGHDGYLIGGRDQLLDAIVDGLR